MTTETVRGLKRLYQSALRQLADLVMMDEPMARQLAAQNEKTCERLRQEIASAAAAPVSYTGELGRCDGETFFGFCVLVCDKPAVVERRNGTNEVYRFCAKHDYFYQFGRYPKGD